jgi:hypothetical protein
LFGRKLVIVNLRNVAQINGIRAVCRCAGAALLRLAAAFPTWVPNFAGNRLSPLARLA